MSKYSPPNYYSDGFNCPYCNAYAHQSWSQCINQQEGELLYIEENALISSTCSRCHSAAFWINEQIIYPLARMAPPANSDLPDNVKEVYEEASDIAGLSARAACALLRVAIEMLLKDLGHLKEKGNINDSIGKMVRAGVDKRVQQTLDIVRVTGNNALHPGTIDFDDSTDVSALFELINYIADTLITRPKKTSKMFDNLPAEAKNRIKRRDTKT